MSDLFILVPSLKQQRSKFTVQAFSSLRHKYQLTYISAITGSNGALNLRNCLHLLRQPDVQTLTTSAWLHRPVCLSACLWAGNASSAVCFPSSVVFTEPVPLSSVVFLQVTTQTPLLQGSFRQILAWFGPWFSCNLVKERPEESQWENCHPVIFSSSVHPLRTSRAAVRKESVWLCSFSRGSESIGRGMADTLPRQEGTVSGLLLTPSIPCYPEPRAQIL